MQLARLIILFGYHPGLVRDESYIIVSINISTIRIMIPKFENVALGKESYSKVGLKTKGFIVTPAEHYFF